MNAVECIQISQEKRMPVKSEYYGNIPQAIRITDQDVIVDQSVCIKSQPSHQSIRIAGEQVLTSQSLRPPLKDTENLCGKFSAGQSLNIIYAKPQGSENFLKIKEEPSDKENYGSELFKFCPERNVSRAAIVAPNAIKASLPQDRALIQRPFAILGLSQKPSDQITKG